MPFNFRCNIRQTFGSRRTGIHEPRTEAPPDKPPMPSAGQAQPPRVINNLKIVGMPSIPTGSMTQKGIVKLSDSATDLSSDAYAGVAATPKAVALAVQSAVEPIENIYIDFITRE